MFEHAIRILQDRQKTLDELVKTTTANVNENRTRLNLHITSLSAVEQERTEVVAELSKLRALQKQTAQDARVAARKPTVNP